MKGRVNMERERNGKNIVIGILLVTVLCLSAAFAALSTTLNINGTANLPDAKWDVKFTSATVTEASTIKTAPTVNANLVTYTIDLTENSTYEFDAVITNAGTYNAILKTLTVSDVPTALKDLVTYTVTGVTANSTVINANGGTATVHVKVTMGAIDTAAKLSAVQTNQTLTLTVSVGFEQA